MSQVQARSTFVTVVAWIFIGLSGMNTLVALMQNVMMYFLFNDSEFAQMSPPPGMMPPVPAFVLIHFQLIFLLVLMGSAFMLVSAIGLLKRRNWARWCFIALLALLIVWQVVGVGISFSVLSLQQQQFSSNAQMMGAPDMSAFFIFMKVIVVVLVIGFCGLFGWLIKRLLSASIAVEFVRPRAMPA